MLSSAALQHPSVLPAQPCDPVFGPAFYAPYEAAVQSVMQMICDARMQHGSDVLALRFRLKSSASIRGKLRKKRLPETACAASLGLHDIAGLRVVLVNQMAVYRFAHTLIANGAARLDTVHDYIAQPKPSGYRSLHLIFSVPVRSGEQIQAVPVEIQLRTPDMDVWACAEHRLIYKPVT